MVKKIVLVLVFVALGAAVLFAQTPVFPGWFLVFDQAAPNLNTFNMYAHNMYVDNDPPINISTPATTCTASNGSSTLFTCKTPLPSTLTPGNHSIALTVIYMGTESARSTPIVITLVSLVPPANLRVTQ